MRPLMNVMPPVAMFGRCASLEVRVNVTELSMYFITDSVRGLWMRPCVILVYFFVFVVVKEVCFGFRSFNIVGVHQ